MLWHQHTNNVYCRPSPPSSRHMQKNKGNLSSQVWKFGSALCPSHRARPLVRPIHACASTSVHIHPRVPYPAPAHTPFRPAAAPQQTVARNELRNDSKSRCACVCIGSQRQHFWVSHHYNHFSIRQPSLFHYCNVMVAIILDRTIDA